MIKLQSLSHSSIVSDVRTLSPQCRLLIRGKDPAGSSPVQAGSLWLYSAFLRSLLASQQGQGARQEEQIILMPGFHTEDIQQSVRMLEVADTEAILVFNGRNKSVLETLGVCLQHHKPLEVRRETISAEKKTSNSEDDIKTKIKQEECQQDERTNLEEIQKLLLDNSAFDTSEDEDFSDYEDEGEELSIKSVEGNVDFEDELDDISDGEEEDFNANKSFELSDDDAATIINQSYQEDKMKEVKALLVKSENVWSCIPCGYSHKQRYLATLHAETHVKGLRFPCKYCPKVFSRRFSLRRHTHKKHRGERKRRENERNAKVEVKGSLANKKKENKDDLDKEIDEKVGKMMEKDGQVWKCKQCDKTGTKSGISKHCESRHLTGYSHQCPFCDHKTTSRNAMREHVRIKHHGK